MRIIQLIKTIIRLSKIKENENYPTNKNNKRKWELSNKNNDYKKMRIIQLIKTMIIRKWELSN